MNIPNLFNAINYAKAVGELIGIIESIDKKLDKLLKSDFNAGVIILQQSAYSSSERDNLLREARSCFYKAITLEKEERLLLSYLGLSVCHYHLKDYNNVKNSLESLLKVEINLVPAAFQVSVQETFSWKTMAAYAVPTIILGPFGLLLGNNAARRTVAVNKSIVDRTKAQLDQRLNNLEELKYQVKKFLKNSELEKITVGKAIGFWSAIVALVGCVNEM